MQYPESKIAVRVTSILVLCVTLVASSAGAQAKLVRVYVKPIQPEGVRLTREGSIVPAANEQKEQSRQHVIALLADDKTLVIANQKRRRMSSSTGSTAQ